MVPCERPEAAASSRVVMERPFPVRYMSCLRSSLLMSLYVGWLGRTFTSVISLFIDLNSASMAWRGPLVHA